MARQMKIGGGRFRLFRHDSLQTKYLIISSHGEAIAGQEAWSPAFVTTMHFNQSYGRETSGTPLHMLNRVLYGEKIESIPSSGLIGDYILSKFQSYHDVASSKKDWKKMKKEDASLSYEETYGDIVGYVDQSDPPCDILTVRFRWFSKESKLSVLCSTLFKMGLTYSDIICLFCRVKQYAYYHDALRGV